MIKDRNMTQDGKIYQTIKHAKPNEWTIEELRNSIVNGASINHYYLKEGAEHWKELFNKKMPYEQDLYGEKWLDVPGRQGVQASNQGRIKINGKVVKNYCEKYILDNERNYVNLTSDLLKNPKNKLGYLVVPELSECVYNLVAKAWLSECGQYKPGMQIHHITDDGYDNRPENLIVLDEDIHRQMPRCGVKDDDYWPGKYDKK